MRLSAWIRAGVCAALSAIPALAHGDRPIAALAPVELVADGFAKASGVVVAPNGTAYLSDSVAGRVYAISAPGQASLLASGLDHSTGLALDPEGRLLIVERGRGRVVRRDSGGLLTTVADQLRHPEWVAVAPDGTLYITAHRLLGPEGSDADEAEVIVRRDPATGALSVVATDLRKLEGITVNGNSLYAAARRLTSLPGSDGVVVRYPIRPDGSLGSPGSVIAMGLTEPEGLVLDRLGALYAASKKLQIGRDKWKRAIGKIHPDGRLSIFAELLEDPRGLALGPDGSLYAADGHRLLRFRAATAPGLEPLPAFTNRSAFPLAGTTEANARVDVFVNDADSAVTGTSDASGSFSVAVPLALNAPNSLQLFATTHAGNGLTGAPAEVTLTHDAILPEIGFREPVAGAFVRQMVSVGAHASDGGSGVASLTLSAAGQLLPATLNPLPPASSVTATATWETRAVADGGHTLAAIASDRAGNTAAVTRVVLVDNTPPETRITDGPSGEISATEVVFGFSGSDNLSPAGNLVFSWRLDGGPFTTVGTATTATLTGLAERAHTFEVRARDLAGNEDPTPASRHFTVSLGPAISSVDPPSGPVGTFVTIGGARFEPGATRVAFNGLPAVLHSATPTTLTTIVPVGTTTGVLTVTTPKGTASRPFTVTTSGDFALSAMPTIVRAIAGDQVSVSVQAGGSGSFASLVSLAVAAPAGISASLSSQLVAPGAGADLTLSVARGTAAGSYAVAVTGRAQVDGQTLERAAEIILEVLLPGTPAVAGRVLTAEAFPQPIPGVTVTLGAAFTLTDAGGNFLLLAPPAGANMLLVDGRTASTPTAQYPPVEVNVTVAPSGPTRVPFSIYLPKLDTANPITLPLDGAGFTTREVLARTPAIPGLTVTIPAGTGIIGADGNPVAQITLTPVSVDRSPMPFPPGVTAPLLFTIQPGGAVPSQPLPISFPNPRQAPPGTRAELYFFDLIAGNWAVWGTGSVSADGTTIASDPGFGLPRFAWHFPFIRAPLPDQVRSRNSRGGDPVDLVTGRLTLAKRDLVLPGRLPLTIERTYRSEDSRPGPFGIGWNLDHYDSVLTTAGTSLSLTLGDRSSYLLAPLGPGTWRSTTEPFFQGAVVTRLPGEFHWEIRFQDGTIHRYDRIVGFANAAGLAAIVDHMGNSVTVTRDTVGGVFGRITRIAEPAGRMLDFAYDAQGRVTAITDPLGRVVHYAYDTLGRLTTVTDPAGGVTRYTYDGSHRILTITDARGITFLQNDYDAAGRVIRQTQADGSAWSFAYMVTGGVVTETTVTNPRGTPTRYRFNTEGFTLSRTDGAGQAATVDYEPGTNLPTVVTDSLGRVIRFTHDAQGNVTAITDPAGGSLRFTHEPAFSRVTSLTDPLGNTTLLAYDSLGNLSAVTDPLGQRTTLAHDASGQLTSSTDPLGHTTSFGYDAAGNLTAITDPEGNTTAREYDAAGRLTRQIDPRGKATTFAHDTLNRLTQLTDALGGVTRFGYDGNGNLVSLADARGSVTAYSYDPMDRLASRTDTLGGVESYEYDGAGNLTRHTDRKGQVSTFSYDSLNRRTSASYADGSVTGFEYDAAGRLIRASDSVGGDILNRYDLLDRLVAQTTGLGTISYQYDALGRRTGMSAPGQVPIAYGYDSASRLTQIIQGSQVVDLAYDAVGRRTRLTLPNGVSTEYRYDAASRFTALIYRNALGPLGDLLYQYDPAGNRTQVGGALARTLLPDPVAAATYNAANRQFTSGDRTMTYDANGNLTSITDPTGVTALSWDARNRLVGLHGPGTIASFAYDALGRRLAKTVDGSMTQYLYDGLDTVQELTDQGSAAYLHTLNIDEPLARDGRELYLADALGSILGLTDPAGLLTTRYLYDPFGSTAIEGAASANPFQFTGREHDGLAGLYAYRARYYAPGLQRFLSEDPLPLGEYGFNPYAYAANNPVKLRDPSGAVPFVLAPAALGAGIGATVAAISTVVSNPQATLTDVGQAALIGAALGATAGFGLGTSIVLNATAGTGIGVFADLVGQVLAKGTENLFDQIDGTSLVIGGIAGALTGGIGAAAIRGGATVANAIVAGSSIATGVELGLRLNVRQSREFARVIPIRLSGRK